MNRNQEKRSWIYDILILAVLALAAYLRVSGVDWGEGHHQHPDELFITGVTENLRAHACMDEGVSIDVCPPERQRWMNLSEYFNTATSTLNPNNRGAGFYVYGNLPLTLVRVTYEAIPEIQKFLMGKGEWFAELANQIGTGPMKFFGRQFSVLADLFTILILYFIVARLYNRKTALLAAAFSALAVMQIQQSHYFVVDLFTNPFMYAALYFAVRIAYDKPTLTDETYTAAEPRSGFTFYVLHFVRVALFWHSLLFGLFLGMAAASKINAVVMAVMLPVALVLRFARTVDRGQKTNDGERITDDETHSSPNSYLLIPNSLSRILIFLTIGGLATILAFRIFQPYAFDGLLLNEQWLKSMSEIRAQATGTADMPWNLQWVRRTHLYSFTNLTVWGLGLPLGILAWAGFIYMGWRIFKGERQHILLWLWTALYFGWQSLQFNATMRYQLPIYPLLAMIAAWGVFEVAGLRLKVKRYGELSTLNLKPLAFAIGGSVLVLTALWAFAFLKVYTRPETRVAASRWIYQNVPGPINLKIEKTEASTYNQPLPFPTGINIRQDAPYQTTFVAQADGVLKEISLAYVGITPNQVISQVYVTVWQNLGDSQPLASALTIRPSQQPDDLSQIGLFEQPASLTANQIYYLKLETTVAEGNIKVCGRLHILIQTLDQAVEQAVDISALCALSVDNPYVLTFVAQGAGTLNGITLEHVTNADLTTPLGVHTLNLSITNEQGSTANASVAGAFAPSNDPRGDTYNLVLNQPVLMERGKQYNLRLEVDSGLLSINGASVANETDYDWTLPFSLDGYSGFGGMYGDLNLQVYWDDNADKLARFTDILNQADYIFIPTNHQYAQITRVPERYPLTTVYYRELIGCPPEEDIIRCYYLAEPGMFDGRLGFELVETFTSYPTLGQIIINDGAAEEAFTFYDHPKVLIFQKKADYNAAQVAAILGAVDTSKAVHLAPKDVNGYKPPKSLMLPAERLASQQAGGTWSQLFNYEWLQNKFPALGAVIWYAFIFLLGLVTYPLARRALPGLTDKGYALSRTLGLVLLAYGPWLLGSLGVPVNRGLVGIVFGVIALVGAWQAWAQREALRAEWKSNRRAFLIVEGIFLALFLLDLFIRLGNPDLWHPAKGGERPMDFSYFNAVLRSTTFPPYDPWFAGGYINYYYYGFVLVGMPVKLLGMVPSIAYNFILPTLFALVGVGAFSIGSNLVAGLKLKVQGSESESQPSTFYLQLLTGFASTALMLLLGNLGTIQMLWRAFQRMGAPDGAIGEAGLWQRWMWGLDGFAKSLAEGRLLVGQGEWYWNPSRVIPAPGDVEPITEFPLFTFLYSDLHAHMVVMMLALFVIAWGLSIVLFLKNTRYATRTTYYVLRNALPPIVLGALVLGAIYPTNTWDAYTYIPLAAIAVGYALFSAVNFKENRFNIPPYVLRFTISALGALVLIFLAFLFYQPYFHWWGSGYNDVDAWRGGHTPISSYFTHWGVFLFLLFAWMAWETREWMAATPLSSLSKLKPYQVLIEIVLAVFFVALGYLLYRKAAISLIALPMAFWAAILLLRPNLSDAKRWVLFMVGTSLVLTIAVEIIVVVGDIGRMNTVFKLYLQAWTMLSVSAAAAFGWTLPDAPFWRTRWRGIWQFGLTLLLAGAAFFTITATWDKIRDRINVDAPHTLDSMTYMETSIFWDSVDMDLGQDYRAIRWMQDNVQGSPVIIEGNCPEYRWCTRFTIYTGLPGVVGWNWHQRQQRGFVEPMLIENRIAEISAFYNTVIPADAVAFLKKYNVRYIIVGQVENIYYPGAGLLKFEQYDGAFWTEVFRDGTTVIYEVK